MALNTAWIETLRIGINERCSCLDLNPLSIGMNPAFSLTENAGTGVLLKTAIPQGIETAIKTLAPYFYNQLLWDIDDPDTWVLWTAKTLWNAAYQGYYVPHEQTAVLSDIQLDVNWYLTMKTALNLLQYTPYTSQRKGLGQNGGGGVEESHSVYDYTPVPATLPAGDMLPMTPPDEWGELGEVSENDTISVTIYGAKYSHAGSNATGYFIGAYGVMIGEVTTPINWTSAWWNFQWLSNKNIVEYKEEDIAAKPFASTIRRYHKIQKNETTGVPGIINEIPAQITDVTIEEGWKQQEDDQTIAADEVADYEEIIETELNDLEPLKPTEIMDIPNDIEGGDGWWGKMWTQYLCSVSTGNVGSITAYPSISFTSFASYRKYNFTEL